MCVLCGIMLSLCSHKPSSADDEQDQTNGNYCECCQPLIENQEHCV